MSRSHPIALVSLIVARACPGASHAEFRSPTQDIAAPRTAEALVHHSEGGSEYVAELHSIIHSNALHEFDASQLAPSGGSVGVLSKP